MDNMRTLFFAVAITVISLVAHSCKKCDSHDALQSRGQILGGDIRACIGCGGYYIRIDSAQYRFFTLPAGSGINLETDPMPINVSLNWHVEDEFFGEKIIAVEAIRKE